MRVAARGPHLIELREIQVHDRAQGSGVADRRNATGGLCNSWPRRGAGMPGGRASIVDVKATPSAKHWDSARELVGGEPPTSDDVPTTLSGEPLDSAEKVREFLAGLDGARTA